MALHEAAWDEPFAVRKGEARTAKALLHGLATTVLADQVLSVDSLSHLGLPAEHVGNAFHGLARDFWVEQLEV